MNWTQGIREAMIRRNWSCQEVADRVPYWGGEFVAELRDVPGVASESDAALIARTIGVPFAYIRNLARD